MITCTKCQEEEVVEVLLRSEHPLEPRCQKHIEPCDEYLTVEDLLRRVVKAAHRAEEKGINAAACGTSRDFQAADDAELIESLTLFSVQKELERRCGGRR